jgi:uncharacterized SAM-binding protein YcdF (DUF218 family)
LLIAVIVLAPVVLGLCFLITWVRTGAAPDERRPASADLIVVLGAQAFPTRPSAELEARLVHAAELWREGVAPRLVCSGGWDGEVCEPRVMAATLIGLGVPAPNVGIDERGHNTSATVAAAADYARAGTARLVLVSSPYHLCRLRVEARRHGLGAAVSAPESTPITRNRRAHALQRAREVVAIWRACAPGRGRREPAGRTDAHPIPGLTGAQAWRG